MVLDPSNSSNLEQLALKGLTVQSVNFSLFWAKLRQHFHTDDKKGFNPPPRNKFAHGFAAGYQLI